MKKKITKNPVVKNKSKKKKTMNFFKKIKVHDSKSPVEVPLERAFWVHNGPVVKTLKELIDVIGSMSSEQFAFHTARNGNDFANWIRDVLLDPECADKVEMAKGQKETVKVLGKYV